MYKEIPAKQYYCSVTAALQYISIIREEKTNLSNLSQILQCRVLNRACLINNHHLYLCFTLLQSFLNARKISSVRVENDSTSFYCSFSRVRSFLFLKYTAVFVIFIVNFHNSTKLLLYNFYIFRFDSVSRNSEQSFPDCTTFCFDRSSAQTKF